MAGTRAIAVAALLFLGGCHGFVPWLDGDDAEPTPTAVESDAHSLAGPTQTGAATPTETPADTGPEYLAPGLTAEGVLNLTRLLEHHFAVLERESGNGTYVATVETRRTEVGFDPEVTSTTRREYVVLYPERWRATQTTRDFTSNETTVYEEWGDDAGALLRIDRPDEPVAYDAFLDADATGHPDPLDRELRLRLRLVDSRRVVNVTVDETTRNGSPVYVVTGTARAGSATATSTVRVREDGYIARYSRVVIQDAPSGERVLTREHFEFETRPDGALETPDWIEEARRAVTDEETDGASDAGS